jgi:hypothetical protein
VSGDVVIINNTTAGGDHGTTEGTIGGSNFVEACSVNPPASWSGGVDPTDDFTSALVNMGHSPRWAAYNFMEWVNDSDNGPENVTATQGLGAAANQVRMTTTTTGIDNNYDITYNSSMPSILSVLPPSTFSGGQDSHLPKLGYSLSLDGINWTEPVNIIDNVKADELGIILVELELPTLSPFLRLEFNPTGANLGSTSGSVIFKHTGG